MANVALNIVVGGEEKAKQAIKELNGNLKQLGTNMKSLDEVFAGNQNSYDYLSAKLKNLTEAQEAYRKKTETLPDVIEFLRDRQKELADKTDDLKQKMEQATAAYDNAENKTAALKRAMNEATKEFNDNQKALNYARDAANDYQRQLTEAEGKVDVLGEEIRKTNGYLKEAAVSADGTATSIDRYGKEVKDAGEDTKSFGEAANVLAQAIVASGAVQGAEKLRDAIVDTAKASIEYESAFAGVRKTVDGTAEELNAISGGLRSMSLDIPMAIEGLAGIAENAGQLGIAKDSILDFTETIAALSVTTNLSAEEAATSLAKFANVTNMSEKNYSNLGSSIVALGNNFATTEADIVAMATRLAATGEIVGLTEPQILAVATALSSVGIEAEAGGSAFSKLLKTIDSAVRTGGEGLEEYARIAGMSASMFASAWEQDAVAAVAKFVDGLGRMDEAGGSAVATLNELGLKEVRLSNAVLALSTAEGLLSDALELSNTAWTENTALADEAAVRYETTESKLQLLKNAFNDLKITVGDELKESFGGAIEGLTDLTAAANEYVKQNPEVVSGIMAVAAALGSLTVVSTIIPLVKTLFALLSANPAGIAAGAILALVTALGTFLASTIKVNEELEKHEKILKDVTDRASSLVEENKQLSESFFGTIKNIGEENNLLLYTVERIERLAKKTELSALEQKNLKDAIDTLNGAIPGLSLNYENLGDDIDSVTASLRVMLKTMRMQTEAEAIVNEIYILEKANKNFSEQILDTRVQLENAEKTKTDLVLELRNATEGTTFFSQTLGEWIDTVKLKSEIEKAEDLIDGFEKTISDYQAEREQNSERISSLGINYDELEMEIVDLAKEYTKAMADLGAETEENADKVEDAFADFRNELKGTGSAAKEVLNSLTAAVESGFNKDFVQSLYKGGAESQSILTNLVAEFRRLEDEYGKGSEQAKEFVAEWNAVWNESGASTAYLETAAANLFGTLEKTSKTTTEKVKATTDTTKKAVDEAADALKKNVESVKTALETLASEYNNAYKSARSSLDGIGGLFGELVFESDKTVTDMNSAWQSQADFFDGYLNNLNRMTETGFSKELISKFADGSKDSAGYLQKIITELNDVEAEYGKNSDEAKLFVENLNTNFSNLEKSKDKLAAFMAENETNFSERKDAILLDAKDLVTQLEGYTGDSYGELAEAVAAVMTDVTSTLGSIKTAVEQNKPEVVGEFASMRGDIEKEFDGIEESGEEVGENFTDGVAKGVEDGTVKVEKAVETMAKNMVQTVNNELQIRSPSKVGAQQGEYYDEGIAEGIEDGTPTVVRAAKEMVNDLESATEKVAAAAGTSLGHTIAENLSKSMLDGLHEAIAKGQAYVTGANGEKIPILPSSAIDVPEDFDREAWLESMYEAGWPRELGRQDILNLHNVGLHNPNSLTKEDWRQMGYDNVADAMEAAEEGAKRYWSGASLLEKQNENTRSQAEKALENLLGLDLKENVGEEKRKEAYETMFGVAEMTYDEAIQALNDAYMQAVKDFRASGQGFSAATLYEAILDSDAYAELSEKAGQNMADETVSGWTNEITTMSVQSEKAVGEMLEETEKANMEAAASVGSALGSALVRAFASAASKISSVGVDGIQSAAGGGGATINLTQNFNTPTATPYQTKVASESGIKAVLY